MGFLITKTANSWRHGDVHIPGFEPGRKPMTTGSARNHAESHLWSSIHTSPRFSKKSMQFADHLCLDLRKPCFADLFLAICTGSSRGCWSLCVDASLFGSLFQVDSMELLEHYMWWRMDESLTRHVVKLFSEWYRYKKQPQNNKRHITLPEVHPKSQEVHSEQSLLAKRSGIILASLLPQDGE